MAGKKTDKFCLTFSVKDQTWSRDPGPRSQVIGRAASTTKWGEAFEDERHRENLHGIIDDHLERYREQVGFVAGQKDERPSALFNRERRLGARQQHHGCIWGS
jgi:hypothetical protein